MEKLDRRRKYYMILDCETATLPFVSEDKYADSKDKIAIAKPLIYDLGWQIIDRQGRVYKKVNYLIAEIFSVSAIFDTAYYKDKRPKYISLLNSGDIQLSSWINASAEFENDLKLVNAVGAYNSMFDYKKAIPFTELYINNLYSSHYYEWENNQRKFCDYIITHSKYENEKKFDPNYFTFRGANYPLFDLWGLACKYLLNNDDYRQTCIDNDWKTASGKYFKTSAEIAYRYCFSENDFEESHTALDDASIESKLFALIVKKSIKNLELGIIYFPFRILGKVEDFEY